MIEFRRDNTNRFTRKGQKDHREEMRLADRGSGSLVPSGLVRVTVGKTLILREGLLHFCYN